MARELINVEAVDRAFGAVDVLQDITFKVNDGDRIGIVGHNGAGKTTAVKTLTGQLSASSGNCYVNGIESSRAAQSGMLGGALGLFSRLYVIAVLALIRRRHTLLI